ncbi:deoxyribodipyrimidine photo-lyase [Natronosporangium hydrolyticum]|uniref:Deoxyribodipyrimidine photo-lyase n=1 Tax=Natronosporangium hydrolyticum TaxID=2811111 RepID=A0A895Y8Y3_9ACTN|nr:deoxyribodipyrimidine photo-lyase [Natronosporangium hydrolyticum]QSB13791.1 deoxyribodipyrimidine photo-lyase [Natronosporangium hydrolyticum]
MTREATPAVLLFTRDLRLDDNPALAAAARGPVLPLFVVDPRLPAGENRRHFLAECLTDLRESLRQRGADLLVRRGDPVHEAISLAKQIGAGAIHLAEDVSGYATRRQRRLLTAADSARLTVHLHPGITVVPAGDLVPASGDHYRVFTPYFRAWRQIRWRDPAAAPAALSLPPGAADLPRQEPAAALGRIRATARTLPTGGESAAEAAFRQFGRYAAEYPERQDDLAADRTSRFSAYLHFGALSARRVATSPAMPEALVRQFCWRDFHHQVLAAFPALPWEPYRRRADTPDGVDRGGAAPADADTLAQWREGSTGLPIVDAGMRQLQAEGFLPNRARLITATYLVKRLRGDWRDGAAWYDDQLVDADLANNYGNWQWVAGTGNDTRPHRGFNPLRQASRFDPAGEYVRRWLPELAEVTGPQVHEPWRLPEPVRRGLRYPMLDPATLDPATPRSR